VARRHDIEWLRVVGMAAVFLVHVGLVFVPWIRWHVQSPERSPALGQLVLALAPWVMPLFMALAGQSAWYSLQRRAPRAFVAERARHILLPLAGGVLVLVPPQVYLERRLSGRFTGSFLEFYPHFFAGLYPRGNFSWHHLWFLAYLFVFSVAALPLFAWLRRERGRRWWDRLAALAWVPGGLLALTLPLVVSRVAISEAIACAGGTAADWHNRSLLPGAFVAGYMMGADERFVRAAARWWPVLALVAAATSSLLFVHAARGDPVATLPPPCTPSSALFWGLYALCGSCWTLTWFGVARHLTGRGGAVLRRVSDAVFPFYMLHQPVIVAMAYLVARNPGTLPPSPIVQAAFVGGTSLVISLVLTALVSWARVGRTLLGMPGHAAHGPRGAARG
jgi:peptidoglycan/LPS O-acetylase OafA/YrhL